MIAVLINLFFGVGMSLILVRYEFPGKRALSALIDLPLAVSPIVVGLALILVYNGRYGWFGPTLEDNGLQVVFAMPGMIMATVFVALPLVIREVVPVLEDMGDEQEQAANSLGANARQTFWRITLPGIKWAVVYGVVLSLARSLGEFGAVKVVAGNVSGETTTAPVLVQQKYQNFEQQTAYVVAFILVAVAVISSDRGRPAAPQGLQAEPGHSHGSHSGEDMSIDVTGVTKTFGDFVALDDVTVSLPTGQLTALLGPSGGGKSTLLRIIAGLDQADTGTVTIEGREATNLPARKRNVGFVFQHYAVFKHMSVAKNVAFGLEIRKRPKDEINKRVAELLDLVHLSQFRDRMPSQLSGGQRQRMALARALAVEPTVLLLDEPFGALDAKVRKELRDWLRRLHDEVHTTTIFVTHDQEEALEVADEIVVINEGRVEQIGSPDTLYDKPANDFVMRFLGETTDLAGRTVRPHDIDVTMQPGELGATQGTVTRILRVGFEVRVTVRTEDGSDVLVSMTRTLARNTGVEEGAKVWLTAAKGAISVPVMTASEPDSC